MYDMSYLNQLKQLIDRRGVTLARLAELVGMARPNLVTALSGKHDTRGSTLEAVADALNAEWVLVPKEQIAAVRRTLEGHDTGPDRQAKTAVEIFLEKKR
jgi:transcriptional regulator with XRE-family HTH domain